MSTKQTTQKHRFPIGTQYYAGSLNNPRVCTVVDQMTVTNSKGEVTKIYYHSEHEFCGQKVTDTNVVDTTIARNLVNPELLKEVSGE